MERNNKRKRDNQEQNAAPWGASNWGNRKQEAVDFSNLNYDRNPWFNNNWGARED